MIKALRGTKDILPEEVRIWRHIEHTARYIFSMYNYKEIRTPIIEEAPLFIRSIGDTSDIVQKEMYSFKDRGGRNIALRPEATASVVRAYLENYPSRLEPFKKFFYIGPMFRGERPQKGRQRQFHQLGIEAIGSDSSYLDVEAISLAVKFLGKLGICDSDITLKINSLGCQRDKDRILETHRRNIKPILYSLCDECKGRYKKNVLRIFDCKNPECGEALKKIKIENALCKDCTSHFESVKDGLERLDVDYKVDSRIVRGLDYYTRTVFEITQKDLGAKDAICAGGRYDNLIKEMGGRDTPAIGFAFGIERLVLAIEGAFSESAPPLDLFIIATNDTLYEEAFKLLSQMREDGISSDIDYEKKSLKAQMRRAQKLGTHFVVIFGEDEFNRDKVVLRDMATSSQKEVALKDIRALIAENTRGESRRQQR